MSMEIISLCSDDEEENSSISDHPNKKIKLQTINIGECTLETRITLKKEESNATSLLTNLFTKRLSKDSEYDVSLAAADTNRKKAVNNTISTNTITLSDDDEIIEKENDKSSDSKPNSNLKPLCSEAISIDDSDSELPQFVVITQNIEAKEQSSSLPNICAIESVRTVNEEEKTDRNVLKTEVENQPQPSTSKDNSEINTLFNDLLKLILEKAKDSQFEQSLENKMDVIHKYYNRSSTYTNSDIFKSILNSKIKNLTQCENGQAANTAVFAFRDVYDYLKTNTENSIITIEEDHLYKVKKLERTMELLVNRIRHLEETEINFDDEEDSTYMQMDKFQKRLDQVHKKYCQYIRKNPYRGRAIYQPIIVEESDYPQINQALCKKYKNSVHFPSYYETEKFVRKIVKCKSLPLTEADIKIQSERCFKNLGGIIKKHRGKDLNDSQLPFIESSTDPALNDVALSNILINNRILGEDNMYKLCHNYTQLQEKGEDKSDDDVTDEDNSDKTSDEDEANDNLDT